MRKAVLSLANEWRLTSLCNGEHHGVSYAEESARAGAERVRRSTSRQLNQEIDWQTASNIQRYKSSNPHAIHKRIEELGQEWDVERALEINASALALTGLVSDVTVNKKQAGCSGNRAAVLASARAPG